MVGGDGSFSGLLSLKNYWPRQLIGVLGTIDNDLDGSDFTIGFSTTVNTAIEGLIKYVIVLMLLSEFFWLS